MLRRVVVLLSAVVAAAPGTLVPCATNCLHLSNGSTVALLPTNASAIDLVQQGLERIAGLPSTVLALNLSRNAITAVDASATQLTNLDLSYNLLQSASPITLPTTLTTLDLSFNNMTSLDNTTFYWPQLPSLQSLNLRGNSLSRLHNVQFPPTLTRLDLTNNPLTYIGMDQATYAALSSPRVVILMDRNVVGRSPECPTGVVAPLQNSILVCIEDASGVMKAAQDYMMRYLVVISTGTFLVVMLLLYRKYRTAYLASEDAEYLRATCTSSILHDDDGPTQFVGLPTPDEKPTRDTVAV